MYSLQSPKYDSIFEVEVTNKVPMAYNLTPKLKRGLHKYPIIGLELIISYIEKYHYTR